MPRNCASMDDTNFDITLIIAFYNEESYLPCTLASLASQDMGELRAEVLLLDGLSTDGSRMIAERQCGSDKVVFRLLDNPQRMTSAGLNIGIRESRSAIIGFGSAHAIYPSDYLRTAVRLLREEGKEAVGGRCDKFLVLDERPLARAMSMLYISPLGAGSRRIYRQKRPTYVDTVFGGIFLKEIFYKCGGYDEELARGQDIEFNTRVKKAGFRIFYHPDLNTGYYVKTDIRGFIARAYKTSRYIPIIFEKCGGRPGLHYLVPSCFLVYLFLTFISISIGFHNMFILIPLLTYLALLLFSAGMLLPKAGVRSAFLTIPLFFIYHIVYGYGCLVGYAYFAIKHLRVRIKR